MDEVARKELLLALIQIRRFANHADGFIEFADASTRRRVHQIIGLTRGLIRQYGVLS